MLDWIKEEEAKEKNDANASKEGLLGNDNTVNLDVRIPGPDIKSIDAILNSDSHFPSYQSENFLKHKAEILLSRKDMCSAGLALLNAQYLSFRHQALIRHSQMLARRAEEREKRRNKADNSDEDLFGNDDGEEADLNTNELLKDVLAFRDVSDAEGQLLNFIRSLKSEWKVIQLDTASSTVSRFRKEKATDAIEKENLGLIMTVVGCGENSSVSVCNINKVQKADRPTIMAEFVDLITCHRNVYKLTKDFDRAKYDQARDELEGRMKGLLKTMQDKWLGYTKTLLLGRPIDVQRVLKIEKAVQDLCRRLKIEEERYNQILFALFDGASLLSDEDVAQANSIVTGKKTRLADFSKSLREFGKNNPCTKEVRRHPVCFVFDKEVQSLPWEAMDILEGHPCSRVPSIHILYALYKIQEKSRSSVSKLGVRNDKVFYILNPNKDLDKTQLRLEKPFQEMSLGKGVVGEWPTLPQMSTALSEMDVFMYCGHGSAMKTITGQQIEKIGVRAIPLLFGCNSGKMESLGRIAAPTGVVSSYLIATSPCVLGFLWSVTDIDVDKWTVEFLKHWLDKKEDGETDIVRAVSQKRRSFRRIVNAAATVVYGLPELIN